MKFLQRLAFVLSGLPVAGGVLAPLQREDVAGGTACWNSLENIDPDLRSENATTDDLGAVLVQEIGRDLKEFFDERVYVSDCPSVEGKRHIERRSALVKLRTPHFERLHGRCALELPR